MKKLAHVFLIGLTLLYSAISLAETGAVNITVGSKRGSIDSAALQRLREVVGAAISAGTVDGFYVYLPRKGGPASTEFGIAACAESGFNSTADTFKAFVDNLNSIRHESQTFVKLELTDRCDEIQPIEPRDCGGILGRMARSQFCELSIGRARLPMHRDHAGQYPTYAARNTAPSVAATGKHMEMSARRRAPESPSTIMENASRRKNWYAKRTKANRKNAAHHGRPASCSRNTARRLPNAHVSPRMTHVSVVFPTFADSLACFSVPAGIVAPISPARPLKALLAH